MDGDEQVFNTKDDAMSFFLEKNVAEKKPHKVTRSTKDRFSVACRIGGCLYNVSVRKRLDQRFHVVAFHEHTCTGLFPSIRSCWVKQQAKRVLADTPAVGATSLKESLRAEHGVNAPAWTVQRGLTRARQSLAKDARSTGSSARSSTS